MDCPCAHACGFQRFPRQACTRPRPHMLAKQLGNRRGQRHLEAMIADVPTHRVGGIRNQHAVDALDAWRVCGAIGAHHGGGGSVGEQRVGNQAIQARAVVKMRGTDLGAAHQHARARVGTHEGRSHCQRVHRRVTAHESNVRSATVWRQSRVLHQPQVDAWCREAGA